MKESKAQTILKQYLQDNLPKKPTAYELKVCKGDTFNLREWIEGKQSHQLRSLLQAKHNHLYHKIADGSGQVTPFDCFVMTKCDAYLVIFFEKYGEFKFIDADKCLQMYKQSEYQIKYKNL